VTRIPGRKLVIQRTASGYLLIDSGFAGKQFEHDFGNWHSPTKSAAGYHLTIRAMTKVDLVGVNFSLVL
jgi:hypothetical protein